MRERGCVYTPIVCNDQDACTTDACVNGVCVYTPIVCNDKDACTTDACVNGVCDNTPIVCNDQDACTTDACVNGVCVYTPIVCNDQDACTTDACVNGVCVYTPIVCNDQDACTTDACVNGVCVYTPIVCNDQDACTTDACVNGVCVYTPIVCNDQDACTTDACVNGVCVYTPIVCNDQDACTTDACVNAVCVYTPIVCNDNDLCTDDSCNSNTPAGMDPCVYTPNDQCNEICRTPGYWATHSSSVKTLCSDVTGAVIEMGGPINVCGEWIANGANDHTLPANNAASAVEAMCVNVKGQLARQLARQLTAAALNCIISGKPGCTGASIDATFALCNAGCAWAVGNAATPPPNFNMGWCISAIDCFNNGFGSPTESGCGASTGCHDRNLPWADIDPYREANCHGPASASPDLCQAAKGTGCGTLPVPLGSSTGDESKCSTDSMP